MTGFSTLWQRYPGLFVLALVALTDGGLVAMLSDATLWKGVGFVLSPLPTLAAAWAYLNQSRKRRD